MAATNLTTTLYERPFGAYHDQSEPPSWFRHTPVTYSGPTAIVFPGTLTLLEQNEVNRWLATGESGRPQMLERCTQRAAIAKIAEYVACFADASYLNWRDTDNLARIAQWKYVKADAVIASKATVSKTNDTSGAGSAEISTPLAAGDNV